MDKQFSGFIKWKGNLTTIVSKRDNKETMSFPKKSRQVNTIFPKKVDSFLKT